MKKIAIYSLLLSTVACSTEVEQVEAPEETEETFDDVEDIQALEIYCAQIGLIDAYVAGQKPITDPAIKLYDQGQTCVYDIAPVLDHAGMQKVSDTLAPWLRDLNV